MTKDKRRKQNKIKKVETLKQGLKVPKQDSSKSKTGNKKFRQLVLNNSLEFGSNTTKKLECDDDVDDDVKERE